MNFFETLLLELGFSWFLAKIVPYLLSILLGFILFFALNKSLRGKKSKWLVRVPMLFAPFIFYFVFYPIYEGDFSNSSKTVVTSMEFGNVKKLTVVAIPNCPYCFESIDKLKLICLRNPSAKIQFLVCTENENDLVRYKQQAQKLFEIKKYPNYDKLAKLVGNKFPSFLLTGANSQIKIWNNSDFGVTAIDEVEEFLRN